MEESQGHEGKCMGEGQGDRVINLLNLAFFELT